MGYISQALLIFSFVYTANAACGGDLNSTTGIIKSPNYPNPYDSNLNCIWTVTAPVGSKVKINVVKLDIKPKIETTCNEYLVIANQGESTPILHCGNETVPEFLSSGNNVSVRFSSDKTNHTVETGFTLTFAVVSPTTTQVPTTQRNTTGTNEPITATLRPKKGKKLPGWCIALIIILVVVILLLIVDLVLYFKKKGVIYTIKDKCTGEQYQTVN